MNTNSVPNGLIRVALPTMAGTFEALLSGAGVRQLRFPNERSGESCVRDRRSSALAEELDAYMRGELTDFTATIDPVGTSFQHSVWLELRRIPYGEVRSYAQVAQAIGRPSALRAVGAANGANPVPVIVPCHRVIGSTGKLVGFGAGIDWKLRLLSLEAPDRWGQLPLGA